MWLFMVFASIVPVAAELGVDPVSAPGPAGDVCLAGQGRGKFWSREHPESVKTPVNPIPKTVVATMKRCWVRYGFCIEPPRLVTNKAFFIVKSQRGMGKV